jgi:large subunit ribosomal protein L22
MISKSKATFVRIAPRKVRYVIDLIRSKSVNEAQAILSGSPRRASGIIQKLLDQALDAAQKNSQIGAKDLLVSKVLADGGPTMKRFRAATMGRANQIKKRTSHIQLELDLIKKGVMPTKTAPKAAATKAIAAPKADTKAKKATKSKKLAGAK